jgi:hypothetical protein
MKHGISGSHSGDERWQEAVRTSKAQVYFNETTRRYIPEGYHPMKQFVLSQICV